MKKKELKEIQQLRKKLPRGKELPRGFGLWTPIMQIIWLRDNQNPAARPDCQP